jgi:hypothetical protein
MEEMGWQESIRLWRDSLRCLWTDLVAWLDIGRPPEVRPCPAPREDQ